MARQACLDYLRQLQAQFGQFHLLPEGGSNLLALRGCEEIVEEFRWQNPKCRRIVALCCGTGSSMAGIVSGLSMRGSEAAATVLGISVLKAQGYLQREVGRWLAPRGCVSPINWHVEGSYHCGGYARSTPALHSFLTAFKGCSDIPLEPVYTGKLFFALFDMIEQGLIPAGSEILAIHTGGIH